MYPAQRTSQSGTRPRPPGYVPAGVDDLEPVTPNSLLMGRRNAALPQVMYDETELLTRKNEERKVKQKQIRKEKRKS